MVKSGHCLQQMQRKEGQQNSQAVGVETEKDSVGEQANAMTFFIMPLAFSAHHLSLHKALAALCRRHQHGRWECWWAWSEMSTIRPRY